MRSPANILAIGRDSGLLEVRALLLRSGGDSVTHAMALDAAKGIINSTHIDLMVLCQTVPNGERMELILYMRAMMPQGKVLVLQRESAGDQYARLAETLDVGEGPQKLLDTVDRILTTPVAG